VPIARGVSQISPPIRILLIAAVAFLGAYMMFLRPKEASVPPVETTPAPNTQTSEPAVTGPGKAVEAAQDAAKAANGETTAADAGTAAAAATGTATEKAAVAPGAAVAKDLKNVPAKVRKAIRQGDVLVLLFWNRKGADDRDVRRSLRAVDTWDGRVVTQAAPLNAISRYGRIARGVDVNQSPTVVVVDPELRAETIVGYTDTTTIDQMVVDALKNTTGLFTSAYLRQVNEACAAYGNALWETPSSGSRAEYKAQLVLNRRKARRFQRAFAAIPAPKRFAALKRGMASDNAAAVAIYGDALAALASSSGITGTIAVSDRFTARGDAIDRRNNRRAEEHHLLSCGRQY
jgi:hypothetical protein